MVRRSSVFFRKFVLQMWQLGKLHGRKHRMTRPVISRYGHVLQSVTQHKQRVLQRLPRRAPRHARRLLRRAPRHARRLL